MRQIGSDQIKSAPGNRQPHIALIHLHVVAITQPAQQLLTGRDGLALDVDTAQRDGAERAECCKHDAAARADLQCACAAHPCRAGV
jgi:hypothetical protein